MKLIQANWDSEFYEIPIAKIELNKWEDGLEMELVDLVNKSNYKLIYLFDKTCLLKMNKLILEKHSSIKLVDKKVNYLKKLSEKNNNVSLNDIITINSVSEDLLNLAFKSGIYSRYKLDSNFEKGKFEKMYEMWVKKSVSGEIANVVFGYLVDEKLAGFITLKLERDTSVIGLVAVNETYRGKGIGSKLLNKVENYSIENNISEIQVATQLDNQMACMFYEANNYKKLNVINIYHIWKNNDAV